MSFAHYMVFSSLLLLNAVTMATHLVVYNKMYLSHSSIVQTLIAGFTGLKSRCEKAAVLSSGSRGEFISLPFALWEELSNGDSEMRTIFLLAARGETFPTSTGHPHLPACGPFPPSSQLTSGGWSPSHAPHPSFFWHLFSLTHPGKFPSL